MTIFYSDVEPLSKYSPVTLHLTPLLEFFTKTLLGKISEAHWRGVNGLHVQCTGSSKADNFLCIYDFLSSQQPFLN